MSPLHCVQFFIFSSCIHLFSLFIYVVYYSDLLSSTYWKEFKHEYDIIIVGSGTAGSLIAHRIATETNYTFIVLEAGGKHNFLFDIPVLGPFLHNSVYDWQYETIPQENACFALNDNKCKLPQGKIVGGSSKLNNMIHFRGNLSQYVDWFHGEHDENYIKQHFEYIENNILHLDDIQYQSEITEAILGAAYELGYKRLHSEFEQGFLKSKVSQKNGQRWSTSDNLDMSKHVITNALVEKVLVKDNVAYGVNVIQLDKQYKINARKGVILSAGTYNTPKILQLSGIGPSDLLKSLGIPVVKNLPVGKNLQDHITTGLDLVLFNNSISLSALNMLNPYHLIQYFLYGKGPLTTPGCEVLGFLSTSNEATPDLQFMVLPVGISSDRGAHLKNILGIRDKIWNDYFSKSFDKHTASILPILLHPKSKGIVHIKSTNPKMKPLIDPKYLSNENDIRILVNGLKLVKKFIETNSMRSLAAYINPTQFPGCENYRIFSDPYWECYVEHLTLTSYHPVGTCSMGLPESKDSVVDTSFKVFGINRLYVADASVLPTLPSGNINAAIAMMASIFFDLNIKPNTRFQVSYGNELFYEYLYKVCIVNNYYKV